VLFGVKEAAHGEPPLFDSRSSWQGRWRRGARWFMGVQFFSLITVGSVSALSSIFYAINSPVKSSPDASSLHFPQMTLVATAVIPVVTANYVSWARPGFRFLVTCCLLIGGMFATPISILAIGRSVCRGRRPARRSVRSTHRCSLVRGLRSSTGRCPTPPSISRPDSYARAGALAPRGDSLVPRRHGGAISPAPWRRNHVRLSSVL